MKRFIPFILLFPVLFSACALFKTPKFERVNNFQLKDLTADHTNLDLSLVISNPNGYSITVNSLDIEVMDKTRDRLGTVKMTHPFVMRKNSADTVYVEISLGTRRVANIISHSSQKVEFIVRAVAVAKVFGVSKKVTKEMPNELNFTKILEEMLPNIPSDFDIPTIKTNHKKVDNTKNKTIVRDTEIPADGSIGSKLDVFKLVKTSISDVGFKETQLTVKFILLNPYGLSFTLRDFPSEIWINGSNEGKGRLAKPIVFDETVNSADGVMVFDLNNFNSLKLAANYLVKKDMDYKVNGVLMLDGFGTKISKPFRFKGTVEVGKKDK